MPTDTPLHMYTDDTDTVIARSPEDACAVWAETIGDPYEHGADEWQLVPDDKPQKLCFPDEPGKKTETRTAAEWIRIEGRCFHASTEY